MFPTFLQKSKCLTKLTCSWGHCSWHGCFCSHLALFRAPCPCPHRWPASSTSINCQAVVNSCLRPLLGCRQNSEAAMGWEFQGQIMNVIEKLLVGHHWVLSPGLHPSLGGWLIVGDTWFKLPSAQLQPTLLPWCNKNPQRSGQQNTLLRKHNHFPWQLITADKAKENEAPSSCLSPLLSFTLVISFFLWVPIPSHILGISYWETIEDTTKYKEGMFWGLQCPGRIECQEDQDQCAGRLRCLYINTCQGPKHRNGFPIDSRKLSRHGGLENQEWAGCYWLQGEQTLRNIATSMKKTLKPNSVHCSYFNLAASRPRAHERRNWGPHLIARSPTSACFTARNLGCGLMTWQPNMKHKPFGSWITGEK